MAAKAQLAKKGLTMPRLELISAHMAANLVDNVRSALEGYIVRSVYGWTDSIVVLHWIAGQGSYKQFVPNRVAQINAKTVQSGGMWEQSKIQLTCGAEAPCP